MLMADSLVVPLVAQMVKNLPALQETRVQSLGREDPPEKEMAPHSSIRAWKIPWTEEPGRLQSMGILQARILEGVAMPSSRKSSQPRDRTQASYTVGRFFIIWATRETQFF